MSLVRDIFYWLFDVCPYCKQSDISYEQPDHDLTCRGVIAAPEKPENRR